MDLGSQSKEMIGQRWRHAQQQYGYRVALAVPRNPRVAQSVADGGAELSVTQVRSGAVRQQASDDLEAAVLAGACPES